MDNKELGRYDILVRELGKLWKETKRHVQFSVGIHELDSLGEWKPVAVHAHERIISGGVYQLKQGQSKRVVIQLRTIPRSDSQLLVLHQIRSVEIGSVSTRRFDAPIQLDSYQDEDLQFLRNQWLDLIEKRKVYLESQINQLNQEKNITANDNHRENILLEELVRLVDESTIALLPPAGSGIPGSPPSWNLPPTIEIHRPLIFLNLDPFYMSASNTAIGSRALLTEENQTPMFQLPLIQTASDEVQAVALWDPTIHDSSKINQVTPNDVLIYLIVRVTVLISKPVEIELVLRKRIAITIGKNEAWWPEKRLKNLLGYKTYQRTSVVYEIVSHIPKKIHKIENRNEDTDCKYLSNDYIEKFIQYGSAIDTTIFVNKLRQEVLIAENSLKQQTIRKATSVPNILTQKRNLHTPKISKRASIDNQSVNNSNERIQLQTQTEWNSSTPSMISRSLLIEEEQSESIEKHQLVTQDTIDSNSIQQQDSVNTLEQKHTPVLDQPTESSLVEIFDDNLIANFPIGARVIVNTGHSITNKLGIIRFFGKISVQKGFWYGIELDEPVGKNNGSLTGCKYFECSDKHGVFVRHDKVQLYRST